MAEREGAQEPGGVEGVAVAAAYGIFVSTLVYFATFAGVVIELFDKLREWLAG